MATTRERIAAAATEHGWSLAQNQRQADRWRRTDGERTWEVFVELTVRGAVSYASLRIVGASGRRAMFKGAGKAEQVITALAEPEKA